VQSGGVGFGGVWSGRDVEVWFSWVCCKVWFGCLGMEKVRCSEVGCSRVGLGIVRFGNVGMFW